MPGFSPQRFRQYLSEVRKGQKVYVREGQEIRKLIVTGTGKGTIYCSKERFSSDDGYSSTGRRQVMYPTDHVIEQCRTSERKRGVVSRILKLIKRKGFRSHLMRLSGEDLEDLLDIVSP